MITLTEASLLKKEIRQKILTCITETIEETLRGKVPPATQEKVDQALAELKRRSEFDEYLFVEINQRGVHILDHEVEFHL